MKITQVEESGFTLETSGTKVVFVHKFPSGFMWDSGSPILQVARDLRNFLLKGIQVTTLCDGRFEFHNSEDPEALRAHLTAWGTKGKTVEEVEDEIIRWLPTQPKKSKVTRLSICLGTLCTHIVPIEMVSLLTVMQPFKEH